MSPVLARVRCVCCALLVMGTALSVSKSAQAVPSYTTQTGQACAACHVGAFGPQLTPFGRSFKLNGYTMSDGGDHGLPLALMLQSSFTRTDKDEPPTSGFGPNNNFSLDQISAFYAGAITPSVGAFIQTTYNGVNNQFAWDNADVRYAHPGQAFGIDYVAGISVNNNPTVQDLWNSTPAWGFPYAASPLALGPAASTLLDGGLGGQVLGMTAFADVNDTLYLEGGAYHGLSGNLRNTLGAVPVSGADSFDGLIPYWRVALEKNFGGAHAVELGYLGLVANRNPGGDLTYGTDRLVDNALDASYQWYGNPDHIVSVHGIYIYENQNLTATQAGGGSDNPSDNLQTFRADVSYSYRNTWTPSVQYFRTTGSADATLYSGTSTGLAKPDSEGFMTELAYVPFGKDDSPLPWLNGRLALQYVAYTRFDGTSSHASDNNTLFLNLWLALDPVAPFYVGK